MISQQNRDLFCEFSSPDRGGKIIAGVAYDLNCQRRHLMTGIQFLTDEKDRKVAVQIDLRKHRALWDDFYDGLVSEQRRKEKGVPFEDIKADLIKRGRMHRLYH
jgi:hypothetical protein